MVLSSVLDAKFPYSFSQWIVSLVQWYLVKTSSRTHMFISFFRSNSMTIDQSYTIINTVLTKQHWYYSDVIMGTMASQITGASTVCSAVCSGAGQRKHQSSASLAFGFPSHSASDAENVSFWRRRHGVWESHQHTGSYITNPTQCTSDLMDNICICNMQYNLGNWFHDLCPLQFTHLAPEAVDYGHIEICFIKIQCNTTNTWINFGKENWQQDIDSPLNTQTEPLSIFRHPICPRGQRRLNFSMYAGDIYNSSWIASRYY